MTSIRDTIKGRRKFETRHGLLNEWQTYCGLRRHCAIGVPLIAYTLRDVNCEKCKKHMSYQEDLQKSNKELRWKSA